MLPAPVIEEIRRSKRVSMTPGSEGKRADGLLVWSFPQVWGGVRGGDPDHPL